MKLVEIVVCDGVVAAVMVEQRSVLSCVVALFGLRNTQRKSPYSSNILAGIFAVREVNPPAKIRNSTPACLVMWWVFHSSRSVERKIGRSGCSRISGDYMCLVCTIEKLFLELQTAALLGQTDHD